MINTLKKLYRWLILKGHKSSWICLLLVLLLLGFIFFVCFPLLTLLDLIIFCVPRLFMIIILAAFAITVLSLIWCLAVRLVKKSPSRAWKVAPIASSTLTLFLALAFLIPLAYSLRYNLSLIRKLSIDTSKVRFPQTGSKGISVDSKGRIYCAIFDYQRLQVYDQNGQFIRGWFTYIPKDGFGLHLVTDPNDNIHIVADVSHDIYDSNGVLLSTKRGENSDPNKEHVGEGYNLTRDQHGNVYRFHSGLSSMLFPKIIKIIPTGEQKALIEDPLELWLMMGPVHAWLLLMLWMLFLAIVFVLNYFIKLLQR